MILLDEVTEIGDSLDLGYLRPEGLEGPLDGMDWDANVVRQLSA